MQQQNQTQLTQAQSNTLPKNHNYMQLPPKPQAAPISAQPIINQTHQQQIASWNYYHEQQQRNLIQQNSNYYQQMPLQARHSFIGHEEATVYQNCQTVAMEQHYGRTYARSPTRRPESPPPLRNYHQTMVLIPYNTESYAHFSSNEQQVPGHQYQRHNVLEYQQVS